MVPARARRRSEGVEMSVLQVIVGSTRPGRVGRPVADWFVERAREDGRFEVELLDLAEIDLPLMDEPNHPRLATYTKPHTFAWSETIARGDAYVFVIPEYNYGMNAATKNALDYLSVEWARKPMGIVSYGGVSGGLRAAQQLKQAANPLRMLTTADMVPIPMVGTHIEDGRFVPTAIMDTSAALLLDEIDTLLPASAVLRENAAKKAAQKG